MNIQVVSAMKDSVVSIQLNPIKDWTAYVFTSSITSSHVRQVEAQRWFSHYAASLPELSKENRIFIKNTTGHIPLLLRPLLKMEDFGEVDFLEFEERNLLKTHVTTFFQTMLTPGKNPCAVSCLSY